MPTSGRGDKIRQSMFDLRNLRTPLIRNAEGLSVTTTTVDNDHSTADGTFNSGSPSNWFTSLSTLTFSTLVYQDGGRSGQLVTSGASASQSLLRPSVQAVVLPGNTYNLSFSVLSIPGLSLGTVHAAIDWYDAGHNYLSTTPGPDSNLPAGQWITLTCSGPAPANAAFAQYGPTVITPPDGTTVYFDNMIFFTSTIEYTIVRTYQAALAAAAVDYCLGQRTPAVNLNWPKIVTAIAFNVDAFNSFPYNGITPQVGGPLAGVPQADMPPAGTVFPVFTPITDRVQEVDTSMGRQYELDVITSAEGTMNVLDRDENFNPSNPNSPFFPNVKVYREIFDGGMWPPVTQGGKVNLLNAEYGVDPTFESYETSAYAPLNLVPFCSLGNGVVVGTSFPFTGTQSLVFDTFTGIGAPDQQFVAFSVPCLPGETYTFSCYVAHTLSGVNIGLQLFDGNGSGPRITTTALTYTRISMTFTAIRPIHSVIVSTYGTLPGGGSLYIDAIQLEPGAVLSPFSTDGPVIYGFFDGFVERWPANWNFHGTYGLAQLTLVDALTPMALWLIGTELQDAIDNTDPDLYWKLDSTDENTTLYPDDSGNGGPSLLVASTKYGTGTEPTFGDSTAFPGDPGGVGITFGAMTVPGSGPNHCTYLGCGGTVSASTFNWPTTAGHPWSVSACFWIQIPQAAVTVDPAISFLTSYRRHPAPFGFIPSFTPVMVAMRQSGVVQAITGDNTGITTVNGTKNVNDGKIHFIAVNVTQTIAGTTVDLWVDGVLDATNATASVPSILQNQPQVFQLGAEYDPTNNFANGAQIPFTMAHVALYNRALLDTEIEDMWAAGGLGYAGDTTGERIARYLSLTPFAKTNLEMGATTLGISGLSAATAKLDAIQAVTTSEDGNFFADGFGILTFTSRTSRYLTTTAKAVFGEDQANGEAPYSDDISFDFDPTQVYNDVTINQTNGITIEVKNVSSTQRYGPRAFQAETGTNSTDEVVDYANWTVANHAEPSQRVVQVTVIPSANPNLWPVALGLRFGDRVTVRRRTYSYIMSQDYFVERIERSRDQSMTFTVTFQLSPVGLQPLILDDDTYGVLDDGSVLGF